MRPHMGADVLALFSPAAAVEIRRGSLVRFPRTAPMLADTTSKSLSRHYPHSGPANACLDSL